MSIRLKDTIYNTANYSTDSDKLDGYDSTHYMQYKSATTAATAQWYRIAQSASGISNNIGIFEIYGSTSGYHTDVGYLTIGKQVYGLETGSGSNAGRLRLSFSDDASTNWGYAYLYFLCIS